MNESSLLSSPLLTVQLLLLGSLWIFSPPVRACTWPFEPSEHNLQSSHPMPTCPVLVQHLHGLFSASTKAKAKAFSQNFLTSLAELCILRLKLKLSCKTS